MFADNDIEDIASNVNKGSKPPPVPKVTVAGKRKRVEVNEISADNLNKSWREVLGDPPSKGNTRVRYCLFSTHLEFLI